MTLNLLNKRGVLGETRIAMRDDFPYASDAEVNAVYTANSPLAITAVGGAIRVENTTAAFCYAGRSFPTQPGRKYRVFGQRVNLGGGALLNDFHCGPSINNTMYLSNRAFSAYNPTFVVVGYVTWITLLVGGNVLNAWKIYDNIWLEQIN